LAASPDGVNWGYCPQYFEPAATAGPSPEADPISRDYRLLVVPGIFGECVQDVALPWEDARRHLTAKHNLDVEYVSVPAVGSSLGNATLIRAYLDQQFQGPDPRKYIVFGYSKGASDVLEALTSIPSTRGQIAAVVTIAGSIFGSRLTQGVPTDLIGALRDMRLGPCSTGDGGGVTSLTRQERAASIARLPQVKTYSITGRSRYETTSSVLKNGWRQLQAFSIDQDSQMIREDAVVPGGLYLGTAAADHWAIALPFDHVAEYHPGTPASTVRALRVLVDHNSFPRVALFEAAVRFVLADLQTR
jgi:hypothetical protein